MVGAEGALEIRVYIGTARAFARSCAIRASRGTRCGVICATKRRSGISRVHPRPAKLDPFKAYVVERLRAAAPERIPASVLLMELRERGYTGGYTMLKMFAASLRPKDPSAPIIRFETSRANRCRWTGRSSGAAATGCRYSWRRWAGAGPARVITDLQHQRLTDLCRELRLSAVADLYSAVAQDVAAKEASFADFLEAILRAERDARRSRAREMFARVAGFPAVKTLDGFDFGFATGAPVKSTSSPASPSSSAPRTSSFSAPPGLTRRIWRSRLVTSPLRTATRCASPRRLIWS